MDLAQHLRRQRAFSFRTFGPPNKNGAINPAAGVIDHIEKEVVEVKTAATRDEAAKEFIDIAILACDGLIRLGYEPWQIEIMWEAKQEKNEARKWPDWRTATPGKAIEHVRGIED